MQAAELLLKLPEVFTGNDFLRESGQTMSTARITIMRLKQRKWIESAGPRVNVYFNLLKDPKASMNRRLEAVKRIYPSAVVIGPACLHAHGWTTQIPQVTDVAVLTRRSLKQFDGIHLVERSRKWYTYLLAEKQLMRAQQSPFPIESVTPLFALKDAKVHRDVWIPDPDDLEVPDNIDISVVCQDQPRM
jgi:hypothetical protein